MPSSRFWVGGFSAEDEWGGANRIQLSALPGSLDSKLTLAAGMSELLGILSGPQDQVGILAPPDVALVESYQRIGRHVQWAICPVYGSLTASEAGSTRDRDWAREMPPPCDLGIGPQAEAAQFQPFAVTARLADYFASISRPWPFPSLETVMWVNSKLWSHEARRGFMRGGATWAGTARKLEAHARTLLSAGPIVIKEDFGVSGKGNCIVRELSQLQSLVRRIEQQERRGKYGGFVIEPLFDKLIDFSGHFTVHEDGRSSFDGFRQMLNVGQRYAASFALPECVQQSVRASSYFAEVETILAALAKERYFGPVCIDGLVLRDGSVVSTLEVNARMSMGRLSLALDDEGRQNGLQTVLFILRVRASSERPFAKVLTELDRRRVLYQTGAASGFSLLGGSALAAAELRWYGAYWFRGDANPQRDFAELLAATQACEVQVDGSFPIKALTDHIAALQSPLQHEPFIELRA